MQSISPTASLAAQTMLATLALRHAIHDLAAAVERVEGKVDKLVTLARTERIGHAAGDRRTIEALVERVRSQGRISSTDWSTVASLGPLIARDIEASARAWYRRSPTSRTCRPPINDPPMAADQCIVSYGRDTPSRARQQCRPLGLNLNEPCPRLTLAEHGADIHEPGLDHTSTGTFSGTETQVGRIPPPGWDESNS